MYTNMCLQPQLSCMEHMAISDWLTGYKLSDYIPLLELRPSYDRQHCCSNTEKHVAQCC